MRSSPKLARRPWRRPRTPPADAGSPVGGGPGGLYREGVERFGSTQGDVYADGLRASIQRLGQLPRSPPVRAGLRASIRILPYRSHIILYELDPAGVHVLRIRHAREDWLDSGS